ncbi:MAG: FAD:protein FMN transferase [Bacteroidetes bacterium]|nr:MAG: FAD:protein FMN transferase [Bacteroidota bacterium]
MNKTSILGIFFLVILISCGSLQREPKFTNIRGVVFGTYYSVSYYCDKGRDYSQGIDSVFNVVNQSMSYYIPNSTISCINRNETTLADEHFLTVLKRSLEIAEETKGAFDPTISPLVNAWGFGFEDRIKMTQSIIDSLRQIVGFQKVSIEGNRVLKTISEVQFDFNAIAKGYAADLAGMYLESQGVETYMVEIGGDLIAKGLKPDGTGWRIGLEKPARDMFASQEWDYLVELHNRAVATSGTTRKYFLEGGQRFSHTIDPKTGRPVTHNLLSVSVFADDAMTADAFATAFMVMGLEKSVEFIDARDDLQAFFIYSVNEKDFETFITEGLNVIPRSEL